MPESFPEVIEKIENFEQLDIYLNQYDIDSSIENIEASIDEYEKIASKEGKIRTSDTYEKMRNEKKLDDYKFLRTLKNKAIELRSNGSTIEDVKREVLDLYGNYLDLTEKENLSINRAEPIFTKWDPKEILSGMEVNPHVSSRLNGLVENVRDLYSRLDDQTYFSSLDGVNTGFVLRGRLEDFLENYNACFSGGADQADRVESLGKMLDNFYRIREYIEADILDDNKTDGYMGVPLEAKAVFDEIDRTLQVSEDTGEELHKSQGIPVYEGSWRNTKPF